QDRGRRDGGRRDRGRRDRGREGPAGRHRACSHAGFQAAAPLDPAAPRQAQSGARAEVTERAVEATGETVGEARWRALRALELLVPSLDKASVRFQVLSEGERGLLGVGYTPARVVATARDGTAITQPRAVEESGPAAKLREVLEHV